MEKGRRKGEGEREDRAIERSKGMRIEGGRGENTAEGKGRGRG